MMFFDHPIFLLLIVPVWLIGKRFTGAQGTAAGIRICLFVILVIILANPMANAPQRGSTVVLVIDRSRSMPATTKQFEISLRQQAAAEQREADQLGVVGFGSHAVVEQIPGRPSLTKVPDVDRDKSNLHAAVGAALDLLPAGQRGRLLVLSDGRADDVLTDSISARLRRQSVHVDFVQFPLHESQTATDVELQSVSSSTHVERGAEIMFDLDITASEATRRSLQILRDGVSLSAMPLEIAEGPNRVTWTDQPDGSGVFHYSFQIDLPADPTPGNNTWDTWVEVRGGPGVLVLNATGDESPLVEILRRSGVETDIGRADKFDLPLEKLSAYRVCVLENVSAPENGSTNATNLVRFVDPLGGGLVISGGDQSFGAGGYRFSSLEPLLPVTLRGLIASERPAQALVVLVEPDAWQAAAYDPDVKITPLQQALLSLAQELDPADRIGLVTPRASDPVAMPLSSVTRTKDLRDAVMQLGGSSVPGGFPRALTAAWDMLSRAPQTGKHLVLLINTDQLAAWPLPAFDPLATRPINGATVSLITWGKPDVLPPALSAGWIPGLRMFSTNDTAQLAPTLRRDWDLATGSSFIGRPTALMAAPTLAAAEASRIPESLPVVAGFHTAMLRDQATASLVAKDTPGQPLLAHRASGAGRVCAVLFPFEPSAGVAWDNLASVVVDQLRWAGRFQMPALDVPVRVEQAERTVTVRLPHDVGEAGNARKGPLELHVIGPDGLPLGKPEPFHDDGSAYVAQFTLNRTGSHFAVARRNNELIARSQPIALPRSTEFLNRATLADGRAVLSRLAQVSGGRECARGTPVFDELIHEHYSLVPVFALLAAILLVLDVADRKHRFLDQIDYQLQRVAGRYRQRLAEDEQTPQRASDPFEQAKEKLRQRLRR